MFEGIFYFPDRNVTLIKYEQNLTQLINVILIYQQLKCFLACLDWLLTSLRSKKPLPIHYSLLQEEIPTSNLLEQGHSLEALCTIIFGELPLNKKIIRQKRQSLELQSIQNLQKIQLQYGKKSNQLSRILFDLSISFSYLHHQFSLFP